MQAASIAYGKVSEVADIEDHPQARFVDLAVPGGEIRMFSRAASFDGDVRAPGPVPVLGSHTGALRDRIQPGRGRKAS